MSAIECCYGYPDRYAGCHAKYEKYQCEREEHERQKELEKRQKAQEMYYYDRFKYWR